MKTHTDAAYTVTSLDGLSNGDFFAEIERRNAERKAEAAAGVTINRPVLVNGAGLDARGSNGLRSHLHPTVIQRLSSSVA